MASNKQKVSVHDKLVNIVAETFKQLGHKVETYVDYNNGEMDIILDNDTYLECKSTWTQANAVKAYTQIDRAIRSKNTKIKHGFMVTYDGYFDVMSNNYENKKVDDKVDELQKWFNQSF